MIPAISDFLTSLALITVAEVEARVVIKKMEGQIEDWKAGRFPSPSGTSSGPQRQRAAEAGAISRFSPA